MRVCGGPRRREKKAEITVEKLERVARRDLEEEAVLLADLRGASGALLVVD
ncbi:MAG: hypothetical protein M3088_05325 [Actinomycetota bacterium]|nr:hypothetical protein [Actinomycetota bacterium]